MNLLRKTLYVLLIITIAIFMAATISKAKTVEITTETLNLRNEPSTESNIVALISMGDECEVLGEEGEWYKVKYKDYTGYISKEYAKVVGSEEITNTNEEKKVEENVNKDNQNSIENVDNSEKDNTTSTGTENSNIASKNGKINKKTEVKIVPLISSSNITKLEKDLRVTVISELNDWIYIQTDIISGWIKKDAITIQESANSNEDKEENSTNNNQKDNQIDNDQNSKEEDNNENTVATFEEKTMYAKDYINIRKEPSTEANIIMLVSPNTVLKVIGEEGDWYKVSTSDGEAYVSKDVVSDKKVTVTNRGDVDRKEENNGNEKETTTSSSKNEVDTSKTIKTSEIVSYAKKFLGVPYVYGGASSSGFDCSGFTMYVYKHFGISMAHGAQSQSRLGKKVSADKSSKTSLLNNLREGDLVFFLDYETMDEIGHCGIYIGDGNFIHASSGSGYCVKISNLLPGESYNARYCAARRII